MESETDTNKILSSFLKKLAYEIEQKTMSDNDIQKVGDFFRSYLFENSTEKFSEKEFMNFLTTGWYIHTFLKK